MILFLSGMDSTEMEEAPDYEELISIIEGLEGENKLLKADIAALSEKFSILKSSLTDKENVESENKQLIAELEDAVCALDNDLELMVECVLKSDEECINLREELDELELKSLEEDAGRSLRGSGGDMKKNKIPSPLLLHRKFDSSNTLESISVDNIGMVENEDKESHDKLAELTRLVKAHEHELRERNASVLEHQDELYHQREYIDYLESVVDELRSKLAESDALLKLSGREHSPGFVDAATNIVSAGDIHVTPVKQKSRHISAHSIYSVSPSTGSPASLSSTKGENTAEYETELYGPYAALPQDSPLRRQEVNIGTCNNPILIKSNLTPEKQSLAGERITTLHDAVNAVELYGDTAGRDGDGGEAEYGFSMNPILSSPKSSPQLRDEKNTNDKDAYTKGVSDSSYRSPPEDTSSRFRYHKYHNNQPTNAEASVHLQSNRSDRLRMRSSDSENESGTVVDSSYVRTAATTTAVSGNYIHDEEDGSVLSGSGGVSPASTSDWSYPDENIRVRLPTRVMQAPSYSVGARSDKDEYVENYKRDGSTSSKTTKATRQYDAERSKNNTNTNNSKNNDLSSERNTTAVASHNVSGRRGSSVSSNDVDLSWREAKTTSTFRRDNITHETDAMNLCGVDDVVINQQDQNSNDRIDRVFFQKDSIYDLDENSGLHYIDGPTSSALSSVFSSSTRREQSTAIDEYASATQDTALVSGGGMLSMSARVKQFLQARRQERESSTAKRLSDWHGQLKSLPNNAVGLYSGDIRRKAAAVIDTRTSPRPLSSVLLQSSNSITPPSDKPQRQPQQRFNDPHRRPTGILGAAFESRKVRSEPAAYSSPQNKKFAAIVKEKEKNRKIVIPLKQPTAGEER